MSDDDRAYLDGGDCRVRGDGPNMNPYRDGTLEHSSWNAGYWNMDWHLKARDAAFTAGERNTEGCK